MILYETLKNWAARCNNRQNKTTNTVVYNQQKCKGWSFITGDGASRHLSLAITFPITFKDVPIVTLTTLGSLADSNPTLISNLTGNNRVTGLSCEDVTTTGMTVWLSRRSVDGTDPGVLASGTRYGFSWIAEGTNN